MELICKEDEINTQKLREDLDELDRNKQELDRNKEVFDETKNL